MDAGNEECMYEGTYRRDVCLILFYFLILFLFFMKVCLTIIIVGFEL